MLLSVLTQKVTKEVKAVIHFLTLYDPTNQEIKKLAQFNSIIDDNHIKSSNSFYFCSDFFVSKAKMNKGQSCNYWPKNLK